jgi:tryptophanyl-tRNA synthetase
MARIFSGVQPSGDLHVGNYLGAIRHWVREQNPEALYCVVDLHALTADVDPDALRRGTLEVAVGLLAAGLDPAACTLFVQSHVPEHTRLSWLLECTATFGELRRMTQFKEKAESHEVVRGGLLTYPALMAADILLYDTEFVPVGDDQRQHLELTRVVAERFNNRYGETFVVPQAMVPKVAARVMDLQEPTKKMSKSDASPQGTLLLFDTPEAIERKVRRAVTDNDGEVRYDPEAKPGVANLLEMLASLRDEDVHTVASRYSAYGPLKDDLAANLVEALAPLRARRDELLADLGEVEALLAAGAERARSTAGPKYELAASRVGLLGV